jgi:hypothetical protein
MLVSHVYTFCISTLVSSFRSDYEPKKEKEEGDETHEFESLNDLPYYLGNCKKETAEKILQDIKQVIFTLLLMQTRR